MYTTTQLALILAGLFFMALVFTVVINSVFMRFFHTFGLREEGLGELRWNANAKPAFGGIGFFIVFLFAFAAYGGLFPKHSDPFQPKMLGLLAASGLGFLMGLADDAYDTRPVLKFLAQTTCGLILVVSGTRIELLGMPGWDMALTVLWTVGMMNAINMLDNMDAVATVVSFAILAAALAMLSTEAMVTDVTSVPLIAVCGALAGFLFYNWHPSRMFMGDTGSQFLGVLLAFVGIRYCWNGTGPTGIVEPWRQISLVAVVFILPLADTTTVTINRLLKGNSPFVGGKDHTTHHLSYAGLSDPQVVMVFGSIGLASCILAAVAERTIEIWTTMHTCLYLGFAAVVSVFLFSLTKRQRKTRPL
ncbi:MAG: undecaprenyl/decaprenyl-phosphate alpha-N-acetylglucosaminyl 1-phosphate transferase [Flavobacteriales bacterium]|nr:undecaprenyl/decaprenyl-phosphate alpha-N-acetylglucosaminyl 1-phosphate transferase [Flavobacteriales bacterium]MBP9159710.1 undecaprenyl/decaprenyl-phosphate alpha-N-acetylglucosaminyl 1-phosphate transferase [Flavobacteriales bacterium]